MTETKNKLITETQNKLDRPIGTLEPEGKLEPKVVKIIDVSLEPAVSGEKSWDVVVFKVKHPDREEAINLKKVKYEKDNKIKISGTSLTLDKEGKISKSSALASLLRCYRAKTPLEMKGKEVFTTSDDRGFLCLKAY